MNHDRAANNTAKSIRICRHSGETERYRLYCCVHKAAKPPDCHGAVNSQRERWLTFEPTPTFSHKSIPSGKSVNA